MVKSGELYNYIVNPHTNRKVSIFSKKALEILNNYLKYGGSSSNSSCTVEFILPAAIAEKFDTGGEGNEVVGYTFDITHLEDAIRDGLGGYDKVDVYSNSSSIGQYTGFEEEIHDLKITVIENEPNALKDIEVRDIINNIINDKLNS